MSVITDSYIGQIPRFTERISSITKQGNRRLQLARAAHSRHPFLPIGDAAYGQHAGTGPSQGHKQHAQKIGKDRACGSGDILADRQTYKQTYSSQYFATALKALKNKERRTTRFCF